MPDFAKHGSDHRILPKAEAHKAKLEHLTDIWAFPQKGWEFHPGVKCLMLLSNDWNALFWMTFQAMLKQVKHFKLFPQVVRKPAGSLPFANIDDRTRFPQNPTGFDISDIRQRAQCGIPYRKRPHWANAWYKKFQSCRILQQTGPILGFCKRQSQRGGGGKGQACNV